MYFLYSLGGVTFNKCWITLSILNCYSPNFQGFILMKNALNNQVGMLLKKIYLYRVDCPGGVRRNIFAKDTKHLSTLFMKRKHERNKHFQFSTGLYLQVLATRESNNNFRTNLVDRKESFAFIYPLGESNYRISHIRSNLFFFANINFRKNCKLPIWRNKQHSDPCKILSDGVPIS